MNKLLAIAAILCIALAASMIVTPLVSAAGPPAIQRPKGFIEETINGGSPVSVDYSVAYDTASGEILQNMMDNLVVFNGEHTDQFLPSIATSWSASDWTLSPHDSSLPIAGLLFENQANQTGPNAKYYYQYDFKIRTGVTFQTWTAPNSSTYNFALTPADVAFSFQRTMVMDTTAGPQWMIEEPLLDIGTDALTQQDGGLGADVHNLAQIGEMGALIHGAVQFNATDVWFNLMFPSAYAPFLQILTQTWSAIESKQWIANAVMTQPLRAPYEWDGNWPDFTSWNATRNPDVSKLPLDNPSPIMFGSGPFAITTLDYTSMFWSGARNVAYWRGWPADFPTQFAVSPRPNGGYANTIYVTWANVLAVRETDLASGACDFAAIDRNHIAEIYKSATPPWQPPNYPEDGVRVINPLPTLEVDGLFFTFLIDQATIFGPINPAGSGFSPTAIPADFFGNATWGINIRKGFAQAFDYNSFITSVFKGEAFKPATAVIPGLSYYDPTVTGWSFNLAAANASFNAVPGLATTGFTFTLVYNTGSLTRQTACNLMKSGVEGLNTHYHINVVSADWNTFIKAIYASQLPMFYVGWLADFPDPHDFVLPFYHTGGTYAGSQQYSNPAMDALINKGIATPDGPARAAVYHDIQVLAVSELSFMPTVQPLGRHIERDWVVGWYYNPVYPGEYYYNLWKWYYQAEAQLSTAQNPPAVSAKLAGYNLPADVNYDGVVNMLDIGYVAHAFGTHYGPPIDTRWVFRGDINNDRLIDMKDIGLTAAEFSQTSAKWS